MSRCSFFGVELCECRLLLPIIYGCDEYDNDDGDYDSATLNPIDRLRRTRWMIYSECLVETESKRYCGGDGKDDKHGIVVRVPDESP